MKRSRTEYTQKHAMGKVIVVAYNVNVGGGMVLLSDLIKSLPSGAMLLHDKRMLVDNVRCDITYFQVDPTLLSRLKAEIKLKIWARYQDKVLCFGNLPPLFPSKAQVTLFLQNRFLLDKSCDSYLGVKSRIKLGIERIWLRIFVKNIDRVIVQTDSMSSLFKKKVQLPCDIHVVPIAANVDQLTLLAKATCSKTKQDLIYVASGDLHKNHIRLFEALIVLAKEGLYPTLAITVDEKKYPQLELLRTDIVKRYGVKIKNLGVLSHCELIHKLPEYDALIYPSLLESFGLPLLEARSIGLDVIASDFDFVRDVVVPDVSFDPLSSVSIAEAIGSYIYNRNSNFRKSPTPKFLVVQPAEKLLDYV